MAILNNSNIEDTPYIESVEGTALIGQSSEIIVNGGNFTPYSKILCNAGAISNIKRSPDKIIFNLLASSTGSFPVEIKNGDFSSNAWNSNYQPILIARNSLNVTNGWLDFRTANSASLGSVTSHINQGLSVKNFANSGFALDPVRGLVFNNSTFTANSSNNFIQFNSFLFPLESSSLEIVAIFNTASSLFSRFRIGFGREDQTNSSINGLEIVSGFLQYYYLFGDPGPAVSANIRSTSTFPTGGTYTIRASWDFCEKRVSIYYLSNLDFLGNLKFQFPINLFEPTFDYSQGNPLFIFYNSGSLSSVIAMKID